MSDPAPDPPPSPQPPETPGGDPSRPVRTRRVSKSVVLGVLGGGVLLITGFLVGSYADIAELPVKLSKHVVSAMGFVAAVALVVMVLLLVLKRWIVPQAGEVGTRLARRVVDAVSRQDVPLRDSLRESLPGLKADAGSLISAFFIGRAYWFTLAALAGILGAAITAGQLVVMVEQTEKLEKQNTLLTSQNLLVGLQTQIAAITSKADLDMAQAQRRYEEIGKILDESKSPAAQEYALLSLPDAMVMPVVMVDPDWKPGPDDPAPKTVTRYPNLHRLAERLVMFAKQPRITEMVAGKEVPSGKVSTAICRALHRVGYFGREPATYGDCLWDLVYTREGTLTKHAIDAVPLGTLLRPDPTPVGASGSDWVFPKDLRHLRLGQLLDAHLPGADLANARLQKVDLRGAILHGAKLRGASLQQAELSDAKLQRADLDRAEMNGADLRQARLEGAELEAAILIGADLRGASLHGVDLREAEMQGADLNGADLEGADLSGASLQGADLHRANLKGVDLRDAELQGAHLNGARLEGTSFYDANLQGADLSASFTNGHLELVAVNYNDLTYWTTSVEAEGAEHSFELMAALFDRSTIGRGWVIQPFSAYTKPTSRVSSAFASGTLKVAFWPTREEAEADVRAGLGEEFVKYIIERPTTFKGSKRTGVFISQATIDSWPANGTDIPPAELFNNAVKDPALIEERRKNQFRLPDAAEFIKSGQAAPAPSSPPAAAPPSLPKPAVRPP